MKSLLSLKILISAFLLFSTSSLVAAPVDMRLQAALKQTAQNEKVPVIIRFSEQLDPTSYRHLPKKERRRQLVTELRTISGRSQKGLRQLLQQRGVSRLKDLWHINAIAIEADAELVALIASRPEVASVSLDGLVSLPFAQPAALAAAEWNLSTIGIFDLWQQLQPAAAGSGQVVAIIDTGVDNSHPNLPNWRGGPYDWYDPTNPLDLSDSPVDSDGHGTEVMGVLAGNSVGGEAIGVAPAALWIAANPFASGTASYGDLHSSFAWALDPDSNPATDDAPNVLNNSWALNNPGVCEPEFQADINLLKSAGIGVVFAAGNSGPAPSTSLSPSNNQNAVAVGAIDPSGEVAWFSARGNSACDGSLFPELVAPGNEIWTAMPSSGYGSVAGTSYSAPHVSGVMALLMQAYPVATVAEIEAAITDSAVDLGPAGPDPDYGYGQIQAMNAWRYLAGDPLLALHDPSAPHDDHHLDFGNITPQTSLVRVLTLRNAGSSNLDLSASDFSGLTSEISLDSDACSNTTLLPGASCGIGLSFAPATFNNYTASFILQSNDPVDPAITVTLSGAGNTPPPAASLLYPRDGEFDMLRPVTFGWSQAADTDGDDVSTALLISLSPDFSQSTPILVTSLGLASSTVLFAGCGLFSVAVLLRRSRRPFLRTVLVVVAVALLLSCGGGGGGGNAIVSYTHSGLNPFTTYYWKVQSTDARGAVTESVVWSFATR